jgi:hypothetical protein
MVPKIAIASVLAAGTLVASGVQTCEALPMPSVRGHSAQAVTLAYWRGGWGRWHGGWGGWRGGCWNCGWHRRWWGGGPWVGRPYSYGYGYPYFYRPYHYGYYQPYPRPYYSAGAPYYPPQPNLK